MLILYRNICCDPSSEPSRRDGSDEGSQHMVLMKNKKKYHQILPLIYSSDNSIFLFLSTFDHVTFIFVSTLYYFFMIFMIRSAHKVKGNIFCIAHVPCSMHHRVNPLLTLKAPNKNCSRRHFNFLLLSFEENNA